MVTRRYYDCDLCGSAVRDEDKPDAIGKPGVGIYHHSNPEITAKRCRDAEHHLCLDCINAVWDLSQRMHAERTLKEESKG